MPAKYLASYAHGVTAGQVLAGAFVSQGLRRRGRPLREVVFRGEDHRIRATKRRGLRTPLQGIRLGDVLLGLVGGEIFYELEAHFQERLGQHKSLLVGLANDELAYLPTREAFDHPTYEVKMCVGCMGGKPGVGEELVEACAEVVRRTLASRG
jgi:hypothetical protein